MQIQRGLDRSGLDPEAIAYYETTGWEAYYAHDWLRGFGLMVRLLESQFHIPFPRSFLAALHVIRASVAFAAQDPPRRDPVSRHLERFYRLAAGANGDAFDPHTAAELELRYWEIHRLQAQEPERNTRPLVESLAALHAALFGRTPAEMWASAESRTTALLAVDRITGRRSADPAADWRLVEQCLRRAYQQIKEAGTSPRRH
jgi:hypothetical protein